MARFLSVCGWDQYQHYKDRDPPWIKLYRDVLTTESWVLGTDHSRLVQVASTLLAARYKNKIPMHHELFCKVASIDLTLDEFNAAITHLSAHKFLEIQGEADSPVVSASTALATCTSETEQSRAEQRESRADQSRPMSASPTDVPRGTKVVDPEIQEVFDHWRTTHNHPKAALDRKRRKVIGIALGDYSAADLCRSISGYLNSPHHMGHNEAGTVYDAIELMLRDANHVDAGLKFYSQPPAEPESDFDRMSRANGAAREDSHGRIYEHPSTEPVALAAGAVRG